VNEQEVEGMQPMITDATAAREATAELLGNAVHRSAAFSMAGLNERFFTRMFRNLVYPQIWEDPAVDMEALQIGPGCRLVAIASGGCNVMSYLTADPAHITAVDLNGAHVALLRLKIAAACKLPSHAQFYQLFGEADRPGNIDIYERELRPHLDHLTRTYWDGRDRLGRRRVEMLARGLYRHGLLGRFIAALHLGARALGADPRVMLQAKDMGEQRAIYLRTLAPLFRRPIVRWLLDRPACLFGLGIPPAQYCELTGCARGRMAEVIEARLARLACDFDLRENYFARQAFGRGYGPPQQGALPPYLERRHFEALRARAWRVEVRLVSLTEHLARQPSRSLDRYVLLDAQDWMSDDELAALWQEITRTSRSGARVIFRTAAEGGVLPGRLPDRLRAGWRYEAQRSRELHRRDRSAIYGGFHIYVLDEGRP
jgi:S-adenosylmethionine-diacylglycerol 3-amino-3-carboxypropyl transferase